ncbi:MAG TPA: wax ester/triacylglycerol synthase family O-acyltransferase [Mycobacteriales bacterium]|jgi:WS/DGAT/MGAT family acyltransferase|nr:wax ester/triacylglycerol synthase family O-acyltransferase [Mycobacteriales bacterium]
MEQLAGMDASFLYFETPSMPQHVLGVMVLDAAGTAFTREGFRKVLEERLHLLPAFTRTLVEVPLHLDLPYWVKEHDVVLDEHLSFTTCPAPGDLRALGTLVGEIGTGLLDRSRPLWEIHVVDGLEGGQVALVAKLHHATLYGAAGADMMANLLDLEPTVGVVDAPVEQPVEPHPSTLSLIAKAGVHGLRRPAVAVQGALGSVRRVGSLPGAALTSLRTPPRSLINGQLTPARQAAFTTLDLAQLKAVKTAYGVKVNDVVLAAVTDALREYLLVRGELPKKPLVATVPMNLGAGQAAGTNKIANLLVPLPVLTADPVERLLEVAAAAKDQKDASESLGPEAMLQFIGLVPPLLLKGGASVFDRLRLQKVLPPLLSLVVSNMQGPPIPLYCAGAQVTAVYPMGPLIPSSGLNLTVLSNMGKMDVGLLCCPDLVPDVWDIVEALPRAVQTLQDRAP